MESEERGGRRRTEGLKGSKREKSGVTRRRSAVFRLHVAGPTASACYFFQLPPHTTSVHTTTTLSPLSSSSVGTHLLYGVVVIPQLPQRVAMCAAKTPFE